MRKFLQKKKSNREWHPDRDFLPLFWRGDWNFYDPKIEICKINYWKQSKINNTNNSQKNVNEIKEII